MVTRCLYLPRVRNAVWGWCLALAGGLALPVRAQQTPLAGPLAPVATTWAVELPRSLSALDAAAGVGPYLFGTALAELPGKLTAYQPLKGERVACLAPELTVALDGLHFEGLRLLSYTGRLYGIYLAPSRPADTELLLRSLRERYGPGQALGGGQLLWQGQVVSVVYEPVVTWSRTRGRGAALSATTQGVVGVLSNALLVQAKADQALVHELDRP